MNRNPVNISDEEREDIERLTSEMIEHCTDAAERSDKIAYYLICKYHYNRVMDEVTLKNYKDIIPVSFPKSAEPIQPSVEDECMAIIADMVHVGNGTGIESTEKAILWNKLQDLCSQ